MQNGPKVWKDNSSLSIKKLQVVPLIEVHRCPPPPKKRIKQIRINIAPDKRVKLLLRSGYTWYYHLTFLGPPYRLLLVRSKENFKYEVSDNNQEENQNTKLRYFLNLQQRFALLSLFLVYPNPTPTCHREPTNCFEINRWWHNSARGVGIVGDFFRPVLHNHLHALGYIKSSVDNIDTSVYHWYVKLYRALGERGLGATHPLIVFGTETVQNPPHKHTHSLRNGGLHGRELYNLFLIFCFCLYFKIGPRPDFDITRLCYYWCNKFGNQKKHLSWNEYNM